MIIAVTIITVIIMSLLLARKLRCVFHQNNNKNKKSFNDRNNNKKNIECISNNNNHNKKYNCSGPTAFKSQRKGHQSNQILLYHYQHSKTKVNS